MLAVVDRSLWSARRLLLLSTESAQGSNFNNVGDTSLYRFIPNPIGASGSWSSPAGDGPAPSTYGFCSGMAMSPNGTVNVLDPAGFYRYDPNSDTWIREGARTRTPTTLAVHDCVVQNGMWLFSSMLMRLRTLRVTVGPELMTASYVNNLN